MIFRIIRETFLRRTKHIVLVFVAVLFGASMTTALLTVYGDITDKMTRELRSFGPNILVSAKAEDMRLEVGGIDYTPPEIRTFLDETELPKIMTTFWRNNITGFAPFLSAVASVGGLPVVVTGTWFEKKISIPNLKPKQFSDKASLSGSKVTSTFVTGVKSILPYWQVQGRWVEEGELQTAIIGSALAKKLALSAGDNITLNYKNKTSGLRIVGILSTGGLEDNQVFVNLPFVQLLLGIPYGTDKVLVSAVVTPPDKVNPSIRGKRREQMTPKEYEIWYCTPLVESIAYQIAEVIPGSRSEPIRQISEAEGTFVSKTSLLVLLISAIGLCASALGVMTAMTTMVMERRKDVGLMKAIGAQGSQIARIFLFEAGIIGCAGGLAGYVAGLALAQLIGREVFGTSFSANGIAFPLTLAIALAVALAGSILPVRKAVSMEPVELLREAR